jgi:hypothetical protein
VDCRAARVCFLPVAEIPRSFANKPVNYQSLRYFKLRDHTKAWNFLGNPMPFYNTFANFGFAYFVARDDIPRG